MSKSEGSVSVGDIVRILRIDERFFSAINDDEAEDLRSMIGGDFKVDEIRGVHVVVTKEFDRGGDRIESHSISVHVDDVEVLDRPN